MIWEKRANAPNRAEPLGMSTSNLVGAASPEEPVEVADQADRPAGAELNISWHGTMTPSL
jgi:hypothetical protein